MQDKELITINGIQYGYSEYYKRLIAVSSSTVPAILCPMCHSDTFQISYGEYECIAHCKCGHTMTIYDG